MTLPTDETLMITASMVSALLGFAFRFLLDARKRALMEKVLFVALPVAHKVVAELSTKTTNTVDDKVAYFLGKLAEATGAEGIKVTPVAEAQAVKVFEALHAQSVTVSK